MRKTAAVLIWSLLLASTTGCITIVRQAISKDTWVNSKTDDLQEAAPLQDEDASEICPPGTIHHEDCRTIPCKVTCKDREDTKR